MSNLSPLMSSARVKGSTARDDWQTPEVVLDAVRKLGPITLDPFTGPANPTGASLWLDGSSPEMDGFDLANWGQRWTWPGLTFINPMYSKLRQSLELCEQASGEPWHRNHPIVALVPARTDTRAFHLHTTRATAICFIRGRLTFVGAPAPAPFPSALIGWNVSIGDFSRAFGHLGCVMRRWGK